MSKITLKLNFPEKIQSINISGRELAFNLKTRNGIAEIVQVSAVSINGSLPTSQGIHVVTIKADDNNVKITSN